MRCPETRSIGAYLLGALDPQECLEIERHIDECAICQDELVEVAHLPGLLHRVTLADVTARTRELNDETARERVTDLPSKEDREPPNSLPEATTPHRVGRYAGLCAWLRQTLVLEQRSFLIAAIIAAVLLTRALVTSDLPADPAQEPPSLVETWSMTDAVGGIDTTVRLGGEPWGTDILLRMQDLPSGLTCRLLVHSRSGTSEIAGWWSTNHEDQLSIPGSSSIPLSEIDRVDLIRSDNVVLAALTSATR